VTTLRNRPFALIGVNSWPHEPGELKAVMNRETMNWRSFDDRGGISRQWNSPPTPSYYIIDHEGIIRRKWIGKPGKKAIDDFLEKLIPEAEQATKDRRPPK
jgi:hypothetical protein